MQTGIVLSVGILAATTSEIIRYAINIQGFLVFINLFSRSLHQDIKNYDLMPSFMMSREILEKINLYKYCTKIVIVWKKIIV